MIIPELDFRNGLHSVLHGISGWTATLWNDVRKNIHCDSRKFLCFQNIPLMFFFCLTLRQPTGNVPWWLCTGYILRNVMEPSRNVVVDFFFWQIYKESENNVHSKFCSGCICSIKPLGSLPRAFSYNDIIISMWNNSVYRKLAEKSEKVEQILNIGL